MTSSKSSSMFFSAPAERYNVDDQQDIVEDSEPEREERRKQETLRCHVSCATCSDSQPSRYTCEEDSHPLLSIERENEDRSPPNSERKEQCNALLPDAEASTKADGNHQHRCFVEDLYPVPEQTLFATSNDHRGCSPPPPIATIEECFVAESDEEDQLSHMRLFRFAYQPSSSKRGALPRPALPNVPKPQTEPKVSRVEVCAEPKQLSTLASWELQLPKLLKCVCCGSQWTTKKTVRQKKVHVEQCAKKRGITQDTLLLLVRAASTSAPPTGSVSNADVSPVETRNEDATLLDSIVPAESSRRGRRKQVITTVRSLPETRGAILGKARDILGSSFQPKARVPELHIKRSCTAPDDPQLTQQFGASILARRNTSSRQANETPPAPVEAPAATQAFGQSALCGTGLTISRMLDAYLEASSGISNTDSSTGKRPPSPLSKDARVVRQRLAQKE